MTCYFQDMLVNNCYQVNLKSQLRREYPLQRGSSTLRDQCHRIRRRIKPTLILFSCLLPHSSPLLYVFCFRLRIPSVFFTSVSFLRLLPSPSSSFCFGSCICSFCSFTSSHLSPPSVPFFPSCPTSPLPPLSNPHLFLSLPPSSFPPPLLHCSFTSSSIYRLLPSYSFIFSTSSSIRYDYASSV